MKRGTYDANDTDHRCVLQWPRITVQHCIKMSCSLLSHGHGGISNDFYSLFFFFLLLILFLYVLS